MVSLSSAILLQLLILLLAASVVEPSCWRRGSFCLFVTTKRQVMFELPPASEDLFYSLTGRSMGDSRHEWISRFYGSSNLSRVSISFQAEGQKGNLSTSALHFQFVTGSNRKTSKFLWIHANSVNATDLSPWLAANGVSGEELRFQSNEKVSAVFQLNRKRHRVHLLAEAFVNATATFSLENTSPTAFLLFAEDEHQNRKPRGWFGQSAIVISALMLTLLILLIAFVIVDTFILEQESHFS